MTTAKSYRRAPTRRSAGPVISVSAACLKSFRPSNDGFTSVNVVVRGFLQPGWNITNSDQYGLRTALDELVQKSWFLKAFPQAKPGQFIEGIQYLETPYLGFNKNQQHVEVTYVITSEQCLEALRKFDPVNGALSLCTKNNLFKPKARITWTGLVTDHYRVIDSIPVNADLDALHTSVKASLPAGITCKEIRKLDCGLVLHATKVQCIFTTNKPALIPGTLSFKDENGFEVLTASLGFRPMPTAPANRTMAADTASKPGQLPSGQNNNPSGQANNSWANLFKSNEGGVTAAAATPVLNNDMNNNEKVNVNAGSGNDDNTSKKLEKNDNTDKNAAVGGTVGGENNPQANKAKDADGAGVAKNHDLVGGSDADIGGSKNGNLGEGTNAATVEAANEKTDIDGSGSAGGIVVGTTDTQGKGAVNAVDGLVTDFGSNAGLADGGKSNGDFDKLTSNKNGNTNNDGNGGSANGIPLTHMDGGGLNIRTNALFDDTNINGNGGSAIGASNPLVLDGIPYKTMHNFKNQTNTASGTGDEGINLTNGNTTSITVKVDGKTITGQHNMVASTEAKGGMHTTTNNVDSTATKQDHNNNNQSNIAADGSGSGADYISNNVTVRTGKKKLLNDNYKQLAPHDDSTNNNGNADYSIADHDTINADTTADGFTDVPPRNPARRSGTITTTTVGNIKHSSGQFGALNTDPPHDNTSHE